MSKKDPTRVSAMEDSMFDGWSPPTRWERFEERFMRIPRWILYPICFAIGYGLAEVFS